MIKRLFQRVGRFFREITTGRDNQSADVVRVLGLATGVQFIWLAAKAWERFDPVQYGTGAGLIIAAVAAAMRVARPVEPVEGGQ